MITPPLVNGSPETGSPPLKGAGSDPLSDAGNGPLRALTRLKLWSAFSSGVLLAASVATVAPLGAPVYTFAPTAALCLIVSAMAGGTKRFGDAARDTGLQFWLNAGISLAGLALMIWLIASHHRFALIPALLLGIAVSAAIGLAPLRQLATAPEVGDAAEKGNPTVPGPTASVRIGTALFALAFGALIAIMGDPRGLDTLHALLLLVAIVTSVPSPWSLTRSARTWTRHQWWAYGVALAAMMIAAAGTSLSAAFAPPLSVFCGGIAAIALLLNAFGVTPRLPR